MNVFLKPRQWPQTPPGWTFESGSAMSVADREADGNLIFRA